MGKLRFNPCLQTFSERITAAGIMWKWYRHTTPRMHTRAHLKLACCICFCSIIVFLFGFHFGLCPPSRKCKSLCASSKGSAIKTLQIVTYRGRMSMKLIHLCSNRHLVACCMHNALARDSLHRSPSFATYGFRTPDHSCEVWDSSDCAWPVSIHDRGEKRAVRVRGHNAPKSATCVEIP